MELQLESKNGWQFGDATIWVRFLEGHWQQKRPNKPGRYPLATRAGEYMTGCGILYEVPLEHGLKGLREVGSHQGFWWSEPWPELPPPPQWKGI